MMHLSSNESSLYIGNTLELLDYSKKDLFLWSDFYKNIIATGVSLVDRMELVNFPYRFKLYDGFQMPRDLSGFNLTYEEVCNKRAAELLEHSDRTGLPIHLLYSGGIDSTAVLISFMKQRELSKLKEQLILCISLDSIDENPSFYYNFIRGNFKIIPSEQFSSMFDGKCIIVGGEHNDQLFGSDIIGKVCAIYPFEKVMASYDNRIISGFFQRNGMSEEAANYWLDMMIWHSKQAPCEVKTNFDLLWWFNFSFKWQSVWFRILLRVDERYHKNCNAEWLNKHYFHFFTSEDFQKWSMLNTDKKIKDSWTSYKSTAKDLIYDYNKDEFYRDHKGKKGSLWRLFIGKPRIIALTDKWEFLQSLKKEDYIVENNSFKLNFK